MKDFIKNFAWNEETGHWVREKTRVLAGVMMGCFLALVLLCMAASALIARSED